MTTRSRAPRTPAFPLSFAAAIVISLATGGCKMQADETHTDSTTATPATQAGATVKPAPSPPRAVRGPVRFEHAPPGEDAAAIVKAELAKTKAEGRQLLVYAGATWCEPCQKFHAAAQRGELDSSFPGLTLLEFDVDEDRERLATAGYASTYIPLFVLPGADGRSTGKQIEGGVKGDGAVGQIAPRLQRLLAGAGS